MKVRLPNFDDRLSPAEKRQLLPQPLPSPPAPTRPTRPPLDEPLTTPRGTGTRVGTGTAVETGIETGTRSSRTSFTSTRPRATITTTSSSASSSASSSTTTTSAVLTTTSVFPPPDTSLIFVNSFPTDFPVETKAAQVASGSGGRGYVMIKDKEAADSMLLFLTFFLVTLFLTLFFLRLTRYLDTRRERRGLQTKEDQMVSDEMRWQEGRLVTERKIVREPPGAVRGGRGAGGAGGMREVLMPGSAGYSQVRR